MRAIDFRRGGGARLTIGGRRASSHVQPLICRYKLHRYKLKAIFSGVGARLPPPPAGCLKMAVPGEGGLRALEATAPRVGIVAENPIWQNTPSMVYFFDKKGHTAAL